MTDVAELIAHDESSGRYHTAIRLYGAEPQLHKECVVTGNLIFYEDLPRDATDSDLCKRCFGG